MIGRVWQGI